MMRSFRFRRRIEGPDGDRSPFVPRRVELLGGVVLLATSLLVRGWLRWVHGLRVEGREHLPHAGSYVLVANHASHLDALVLMAALPWRRLLVAHPAAAADYFFVWRPIAALARGLLNAVPFVRGPGSASSIADCRHLLAARDRVLILFPEGTRAPRGRSAAGGAQGAELGRFRSGIGRIVAGSEVPVVPCWLEGAQRAWPKGRLLPKPSDIRLCIGPARCFVDLAADPSGARDVATVLENDVRALSKR